MWERACSRRGLPGKRKLLPNKKAPTISGSGLLLSSLQSIAQIGLMNWLIPMGRALVLRRPHRFAPAQIIVSMQRPVRITQQFAGKENDIGLTSTQNVLGLGRLGNHADSAGGDA